MTGRQTKLTEEVKAIIIESVAAGMSYEHSALRAGITRKTLQSWKVKGETGLQPYCDFLHSLTRVEHDRQFELVNMVKVHAVTDPKSAQWLLAVKYPKQYSTRQEVTGAGGAPLVEPIKQSEIVSMSDEQVDSILERLERGSK